LGTILDERLAVMPGLLQLLEKLERASIPKAIATSSGPDFVRTVLSKFELAPRFQFILTCDDISRETAPGNLSAGCAPIWYAAPGIAGLGR